MYIKMVTNKLINNVTAQLMN